MRNKILMLFVVLLMMTTAVSAAVSNPTVTPPYPDVDEDVTVCVDATSSPVTLTWNLSNDLGVLVDTNSYSMYDDGTHGDTTASDGTYCRLLSSSTLEPENDWYVDYALDDPDTGDESGTYYYDDEDPEADADGPYTCNEGEIIPLDGSGSSDNHPDGIHTYTWSAQNGGTFDDPSLENPMFTCYGGDGVYTIDLEVNDTGGRTDEDSTTVTVSNVAPVADANGPYVCPEGGSVTLDGSNSSDTGLDVLTYEWDFDDDGLFDDATGVSPVFDCGDGLQVIPIALRVSDEATSDEDTSQVTVVNSAPMITNMEVVEPVYEGSATTLTVDFTDYALDTHTAVINWGDGSADTIVDPANTPIVEAHTYDDGDDTDTTYTITVNLTDDDSALVSDTLDVDVYNVAPTADAGGPYNAERDQVFCGFAGSATDPAGSEDTLTFYWIFDYTGGLTDPDDFVAAADDSGVDLTSPCNEYDTSGAYTVGLMVCDEDYNTYGLDSGCSAIDTADLIVSGWIIELNAGWNLISIPLIPEDNSIDTVFFDQLYDNMPGGTDYTVMSYQYDEDEGENAWYQSRRTGYGDLDTVVPGYAYWVNVINDTNLTGNGSKYSEWGLPPSVYLNTGWNLIGKFGVTPVELGNETSDLVYADADLKDLADYTVVAVDDSDLSMSDVLGDSDDVDPEEGYWALMGGNDDAPIEYTVSNADYDIVMP